MQSRVYTVRGITHTSARHEVRSWVSAGPEAWGGQAPTGRDAGTWGDFVQNFDTSSQKQGLRHHKWAISHAIAKEGTADHKKTTAQGCPQASRRDMPPGQLCQERGPMHGMAREWVGGWQKQQTAEGPPGALHDDDSAP